MRSTRGYEIIGRKFRGKLVRLVRPACTIGGTEFQAWEVLECYGVVRGLLRCADPQNRRRAVTLSPDMVILEERRAR